MQGCNESFPLEKLFLHLKDDCEFVYIKCKYCTKYILRNKFDLESCIEYP